MTWNAIVCLVILCAVAAAQSDVPIAPALQAILANASAAPLHGYPTSLTQGILPKGFHSHNDYWRPVPVYSALAAGAISIEADVWLVNGTLHVGHERTALTAERTLDALYIQPLLSVLAAQNPNSPFVHGTSRHGVFDTAAHQTLYLFIDVKTDGPAAWPYVVEALGPLRDAGYLTTFDGTKVAHRPITVVGTGHVPLPLVQGVAPRDYFWDAPLEALATMYTNVTAAVSPIASTEFGPQFGAVVGQAFNSTQLTLLTAQVRVAHAKGIQVRYWGQPGWPVGTRNAIWRTLWDHGVDLLNVDDLAAVANLWTAEG